MDGRRVHPERSGNLDLSPGDYGRTAKGVWWVCPPVGSLRVAKPETVTEHPDGTITIDGLIANKQWKGRLVNGVWQQEG